MGRDLTERESAVLVAMIERGEPESPDDGVRESDRRTWLAQVPVTRAGQRCGCGTCPSIELEVEDVPGPGDGRRVVLSAGAPGGLLLLFVDGGRLGYLELAPVEVDRSFGEFPPVGEIRFG